VYRDKKLQNLKDFFWLNQIINECLSAQVFGRVICAWLALLVGVDILLADCLRWEGLHCRFGYFRMRRL